MDGIYITSVTEAQPQHVTIPTGTYMGTWGGDEIKVSHKNKKYILKTSEAIRGIGVKVVVRVNKEGDVSFETIDN